MRNKKPRSLELAIAIAIAIARILPLWGLGGFLVSCTTDTYESGDGDLSYLKAEFALVNTDHEGKIGSFTTDDDTTIPLASPQYFKNAKADTVYRAVVYYNANERPVGQIRSLKSVGVCTPFKESDKLTNKPNEEQFVMKTDPIEWESMWLSKNRSWVNLSLNLLVGVADGEDEIGQQALGVRIDREDEHHLYYTLFHDQNGVPEYFTKNTFISFRLDDRMQQGDSVTVTVNTHHGEQQKTIIVH